MRLLALVVHRLVWFVPTLLGLLVVTFVISHVIPADPVALIAGETATPAQIEALRKQLGYDGPDRRRSREPPARDDLADARGDYRLDRPRHPARRGLGRVAQLVPRPRSPGDHGVGSRDRELLARHHAAAPLRDAARLDAAR